MEVNNLALLREPMPMPNPAFPIKIHPRWTSPVEVGSLLFPHHWHEHIEFLYFVSGKATIECGSVPYTFNAGDLCVVNSNELHYGIANDVDLSYYAMIVDLSLLHSHSEDAVERKFISPITENRILFHNKIASDGEIAGCMMAIHDELEREEIGYELAIKSHLYRLLSLLVRGHVATVRNREEYDYRIKELERLAPVFLEIDKRYKEKLTVQRLADLVGLSRFHFSRLFKQLTDKSLVEYINLVRINKSESMLRSMRMTISEVAHETGFNDIYYFSRTFKKLKKMSPSEWRNAARK
ncbi:AraC family transcriptional regulator [Cohnella faecalis]|uniref:AraC family transcriptional regulator n=2 Tax=Cohnella faecalis TaxID=2315694 RepID=A0A398CLP3_9BACL|nr:AraC family transcriptional regulator [Cohnella faecalis]